MNKSDRLAKDLEVVHDSSIFYCPEDFHGPKEQDTFDGAWFRIKDLAREGHAKAAHPDPASLARLLDGLSGMVASGIDKGAINKTAGKAMILLARKTSKKLLKSI